MAVPPAHTGQPRVLTADVLRSPGASQRRRGHDRTASHDPSGDDERDREPAVPRQEAGGAAAVGEVDFVICGEDVDDSLGLEW